MKSWEIIDTPEFQRLRSIKALGCTVFVFHNANHTVFEHSLGVAYLGRKLMKRLRKDQPELNITEKDINNVTIAGLCHDLAAGPFTSAFNRFIEKKEYTKSKFYSQDWDKAELSMKMLRKIVAQKDLEFEFSDFEAISEIITGNCSTLKHKEWMCDIITNNKNMIDMRLFDSINRDTHKLGLFYSSFDNYPLFSGACVIANEICYPVTVLL